MLRFSDVENLLLAGIYLFYAEEFGNPCDRYNQLQLCDKQKSSGCTARCKRCTQSPKIP